MRKLLLISFYVIFLKFYFVSLQNFFSFLHVICFGSEFRSFFATALSFWVSSWWIYLKLIMGETRELMFHLMCKATLMSRDKSLNKPSLINSKWGTHLTKLAGNDFLYTTFSGFLTRLATSAEGPIRAFFLKTWEWPLPRLAVNIAPKI